MKVYVYCNIRQKTLSVRALEGPLKGRVIASAEQILLDDVEFRVSQAGRRRVLREKRKNVHAGVIGTPTAIWGAKLRDELDSNTITGLAVGRRWPPGFRGTRVRYNPYEAAQFVVATGRAVNHARRVKLDRCGIRAVGLN